MTTPHNATDGANKDHNVKDLNKLVSESAREMLAINAQRSGLNVQASEIRKKLREAGIQTKAFDYALKISEMEAEGRDSYMDSLRLCWGGLQIGEQLDWLAGAATAPDTEAAHAVNDPDATTH